MDPAASLLRELIRQRTGISVDDYAVDIFMEKLSSLILDRGLASAMDYYYLLKYDPEAESEWPKVVDAVSVRETYFFREMAQIEALVEVILPDHFRKPGAQPFRIWSAACASGEEPLTIAMAIEEAGLGKYPIEIVASDASPAALAVARNGVYRGRSFRNMTPPVQARYFKLMDKEYWRVHSSIHGMVTWRNANLMLEEEIAPLAASNVIFCRNVFIYFEAETIRKVVRSFARYMRPPAYLFLGAPESLLRLNTDFELREVGRAFVYVRVGEG